MRFGSKNKHIDNSNISLETEMLNKKIKAIRTLAN